MNRGLRAAILILVGVCAVILEITFPGTSWTYLVRGGLVAGALVGLGHLAFRAGILGSEADPPLGVRGGTMTLRVGLRPTFFGMARIRLDAFGWRWLGPRIWVGWGPVRAELTLTDLPRGEHTLFPEVWYEDPIGIVSRPVETVEIAVQVRPVTIDVDPGALLARTEVFARGLRRKEDARDPAGARPFSPGDRLARIHWPLTARLGELQVRESWRRDRLTVPVGLDVRRSAYASEEAFEIAVSVAGSLVLSSRRRGVRCSLAAGQEAVFEGDDDARVARVLTRTRLQEGIPAPESSGFLVTGGPGAASMPKGEGLIIAVEAGTEGEALRILSLEDLLRLVQAEYPA